MPYPAIISLLPAATEIVCALGLQHNLVGRSHECDFPPEVQQLLVCSEANFEDGLNSGEIDVKVKEILADALSVYSVKRDVIKSLAPDVVITQAQCEVCAVSLPEVEAALDNYLERPAKIISLAPNSLADILTDIKNVGDALGAQQQAADLLELMEERLDIIKHKLKFITEKPTVACIEWLDPLMICGNWIPEMVEIAGGTTVLAKAGAHSPYVEWNDILNADPDIIVLMPCGFAIERTMREVNLLLQQPGFNDLKAVKNNRLYLADGNHYFNRPGPRVVDAVEILAEIINPKQFIFGYEGEGWVKFSI